jgi:hypothetical protein
VEAHEISSFFHCKQEHAEDGDRTIGNQFAFASIDCRAKLVLNDVVGKRTSGNGLKLFGSQYPVTQ